MAGVKFFVEGEPQGKARPRVTRNGTFTPKKTREYESFVREMFLRTYPAFKPFAEGTPLNVIIIAKFRIPKSYSNANKTKIAEGTIYPTKKPDADNIAKAILDPLNGIVFHDDKQVVDCLIQKRYALSDEDIGVQIYIGENIIK